jgi:hypothetical protein
VRRSSEYEAVFAGAGVKKIVSLTGQYNTSRAFVFFFRALKLQIFFFLQLNTSTSSIHASGRLSAFHPFVVKLSRIVTL